MKTITENYNGKVLAIANRGFNIKNAISRIEKALSSIGFSSEIEIANTGSAYITIFDKNDLSVTNIRVSNHTKRGQTEVDTFVFTTDIFGCKCFESINVCSTSMLTEFLTNINLLTQFN